MAGGEKKSFWDRFDILTKRWQTVAALIVALGIIVGFVGSKMGWHWPTEQTDTTEDKLEEVFTRVRYTEKAWVKHIVMSGARPFFQAYAGYRNLTDGVVNDVVLQFEFDGRIEPVLGSATLTNGNNPNGKSIGDGVVGGEGFKGSNVGNYNPDATAYVRYTFTLDHEKFPCGDTLLAMRSFVRFEDREEQEPKYSPEVTAVYHKACDKPLS